MSDFFKNLFSAVSQEDQTQQTKKQSAQPTPPALVSGTDGGGKQGGAFFQGLFDLGNSLTTEQPGGTMGADGGNFDQEVLQVEEGVVGDGMFNIESFVDKLGNWEGTKDHTDQIGKFTYGYGVLPDTAKALGINYDKNSDRRANALQVYAKLNDKIKKENPEIDFDKLGNNVATAVFSTYINLGSFKNAGTLAGKLASGDIQGAADALFLYKNVREADGLKASKGLVARRAKEYNLFLRSMGKESGFVRSVSLEGEKASPVFVLKDESGKELKRIPSKYPLANGNSFKAVSIESPIKVAKADPDEEFLSKAEKITKASQA